MMKAGRVLTCLGTTTSWPLQQRDKRRVGAKVYWCEAYYFLCTFIPSSRER